jgi:hypothetical protein
LPVISNYRQLLSCIPSYSQLFTVTHSYSQLFAVICNYSQLFAVTKIAEALLNFDPIHMWESVRLK